LLFPVSITLLGSQSIHWSARSARDHRSDLLDRLCSTPVDLINPGYSANRLLGNLSARAIRKTFASKGICPRRRVLKTRKKIQFS